MKLDHLQFPDKGWGYLPPTEEVFNVFKWYQERYAPKSVLEIGFHVGHSTTYMLEIFDNLKKIISISPLIDRIEKKVSEDRKIDPLFRKNAADYLTEYYKGKFTWFNGTTKQLYDELHNYMFDFAFVDGDHEDNQFLFDIATCESLVIPFIMIDNWERYNIRKAYKKSNSKYAMMKVFYYHQTFKNKSARNEIALMKLTR